MGDIAYAASNHLALRLTAGGFFSLANLTGAVLYYKNAMRTHFYAGALFNFQSNEIHRHTPELPPTYIYASYGYSCRYLSPGAVAGLSIRQKEDITHQLILKVQYNIVDKYQYSLDKGIGGLSGYTNKTLDHENLDYTIPSFVSIEPAYALLFETGKRRYFKLQVSVNLCQTSYVHNYVFNNNAYVASMVSGKMAHPTNLPVNISLGFIFHSTKKSE